MSHKKENVEIQQLIENSMKKLHNESFNEWVQNFAINLNDIWNEKSASILEPKVRLKNTIRSAIVIGRGPSLKKKNHLQLLRKSNYCGSIVCSDGALIQILNEGVTPEKFPNFYVITIDPYKFARKFYDDPLVDKYGHKIKGIFTTITKPTVVKRARKAGIKIHWVHSLFDYHEGQKSFNNISALMVRAKNHTNGLPAIQTGGNAGTSAWFFAWRLLKCNIVALIGIDHAWDEDDPWEKIISHGRSLDPERKDERFGIDKNNPMFQKLFKKIYNPDFKCYCIIDPLFKFYSEALKEFITRSPSWLTTINATEGGSIFGHRIKCMEFKKFLYNYKS